MERGPTTYLTVARTGHAEIEVARSRFRCTLVRVEDELAVRALVEGIRREHWDARHHCSAFVIGPDRALERCHDDGEPPGTAGAPMLDVLRGRELSDLVAVVTRWFGGVLLGTGGLARAYADAVRAGLADAGTLERAQQEICEVTVDHADAGRLEHELRARGTVVLGVEYADRATLRLAVSPASLETAAGIVAEVTGGAARLVPVGREWADR